MKKKVSSVKQLQQPKSTSIAGMLDRKENINQEGGLPKATNNEDGSAVTGGDIQKIRVSKGMKPEMLLIKRSAINSIVSTGDSHRNYDNETFEDINSVEGPPRIETVTDKEI
jgi:hypothetical protein